MAFVLVLMQSYTTNKKIKRENPDIASLEIKNKKSILEKIFSDIKIFITCFIPIINVCIFYVVLFKEKEVEESVLNDILKNRGNGQ